jgi:hypothetical protein
VLKDRESKTVLFHVTFTLVSTEKDDTESPLKKGEENEEGPTAPTLNGPETTEDDLD